VSAPTFYLAASSALPLAAESAMRALEAQGWENAYDWTALDAPREQWPRVARDEIDAAGNADLFVVLATETPLRGALVELGARLYSRKVAHVVGVFGVGFFDHHPNVVSHDSWEDFLPRAKCLHVGLSVAEAAGRVA
jgi:hypothetical protein